MASSEQIKEAQLAAIASHFGLGSVHSHESALGTNDNSFIITDTGSYLVKHLVNTTLEDILGGLPFLHRLQESSFPAAAYYLKSANGESCFHSARCDAVVLPRLPGTAPTPSPAVNRAVGIALAQLHLILPDNLPRKRHWLDASYLPEALEMAVKIYGVEGMQETLRVFHSLGHFQPTTFPQSMVHGDLDPSNCLFEEKRLVAFVDWQEVGVGAAIMDVAGTVLGFCFVDQDEGSQWWALLDPDLYCAFSEGYSSVRPFSQYEREHLDTALKYVGLIQPVWSMLRWEHYHPGEKMVETNLLYWKYGLDRLILPVFK